MGCCWLCPGHPCGGSKGRGGSPGWAMALCPRRLLTAGNRESVRFREAPWVGDSGQWPSVCSHEGFAWHLLCLTGAQHRGGYSSRCVQAGLRPSGHWCSPRTLDSPLGCGWGPLSAVSHPAWSSQSGRGEGCGHPQARLGCPVLSQGGWSLAVWIRAARRRDTGTAPEVSSSL